MQTWCQFYASIQAVGLSSVLASQRQHRAVLQVAIPDVHSIAAHLVPLLLVLLSFSFTHWGAAGSEWELSKALSWVNEEEWQQASFYTSLPQETPFSCDKIHLCSDWTAILVFTLLTTITRFPRGINLLLQPKYFLSRGATWLDKVGLKWS